MSFVTGWLAAAGLAAASIPVIIHLLLRRRRKPMFWGAMALLLEATRRQRRRTQLEQVILLTIRCLFFALAGLALAQPLMQDITSTGRSRVVHLLIDDGIVSGVMDPDGQTALERHAAQAAKKLSSLVPGDRVTVTLASRPVRAIVEAPSSDMRSIGLVLDGLSSREGATDFTAALNLVAPRLQEPGLDHEIHLLGDFRAGSIQQDDLPNQINVVEGATLDIRVSPPTSLPRSNVQVESIEVARNPASTASSAGTGMIRVSVRLRRNGEMPSGRTTVRLEGDAIAALPPRMVEWTPGRAEAVVEFQARVGKGGGVVKAVLDHDALPADDQRFTTVDPPGPITVLLVDREDIHGGARLDQLGVSGWIERALDPVRESNVFDAAVRIDSTDPASLDARDLEDASVVFLARPDLLEPEKMEVLASYLGRGGVVVVIPPTKAVARPWASPMLEAMNVPWSVALEPEVMEEPRALSSRQPDSSLLKLLASELPSLAPSVRINRRLPIEGFADAEAVLLDSEGDAVILETGVGAGRLVFLAFAPVLEWTDLPVRPLMVPLVHEIVRRGSALAGRSMGGVVGESAPLVRSPAVVAIIDNDGTRLSRTSGDRFDIPEHSGAYQAVGSTDTNIETVVVNPAIDAAQVARVSREELTDWLSNAGDFSYLNNEGELDTSDAQVLNGSDIAFILFMIAAALVLLETAAPTLLLTGRNSSRIESRSGRFTQRNWQWRTGANSMSSEFMRWLLGVRTLPDTSDGLRLAWERPFPDWVWMLVVLGCVALATWSYWRLEASRAARIGLGALRGLLLILVAILLSGPMIELPRVFIEPDWAVVLLDRSRSMHIKDATEENTSESRITREESMRKALVSAGEKWRTPGETRRILWLGFGEGIVEFSSGEPGADLPVDIGEAEGWRTRMAPALEEALRRTAGRPLAGVVLLSDGRTEAPPDRELIRRLAASAGEVHVVPLGSRIPIGDTSVARVESPRRAFSRDSVPVSVRLESRGRSGPVLISLVDQDTGEVLDEQTIELDEAEESQELVLTSPPSSPGAHRWAVRIASDNVDLVPENDQIEFSLELIDRPLRVLFVEGYPRWEYRYLKNLLVREATIESSVMLMSADRDFAQEGNAPIARLPGTAEEFAEYDLIILGDLPAGFLSEQQQELIREQVAKRGGGLLFIGGPRSLPSTWDGRPLAELFPFTGPLDLARLDGPVVMEPTESATRLGVLQMVVDGERGWPEELSDPTFGWPVLHWAQRIEPTRLKPTADVLAEGVGVEDGDRSPLVLGMRYGAGQVIYVATDEIWRWRYGRGELIPEQFWVQLLRLLGREAAEDDATLLMRAEPERTVIGRPVRISIELIDTSQVSAIPDTVRVDAIDEDGNTIREFELAATSPVSWGDTWVPDRSGIFTLRLIEPGLSITGAETEMPVEVLHPDNEIRYADADHDLLESIANATSGEVHAPGAFQEIELPNRSFTMEQPLSERIWTSPLALFLLVLLASLEWVGRRLVRLD